MFTKKKEVEKVSPAAPEKKLTLKERMAMKKLQRESDNVADGGGSTTTGGLSPVEPALHTSKSDPVKSESSSFTTPKASEIINDLFPYAAIPIMMKPQEKNNQVEVLEKEIQKQLKTVRALENFIERNVKTNTTSALNLCKDFIEKGKLNCLGSETILTRLAEELVTYNCLFLGNLSKTALAEISDLRKKIISGASFKQNAKQKLSQKMVEEEQLKADLINLAKQNMELQKRLNSVSESMTKPSISDSTMNSEDTLFKYEKNTKLNNSIEEIDSYFSKEKPFTMEEKDLNEDNLDLPFEINENNPNQPFNTQNYISDDIIKSRLDIDEPTDEDYSVNLTQDLKSAKERDRSTGKFKNGTSVLKEKISDLESELKEVKQKLLESKKREEKMIINLSKDKVIAQYERRIKELAEKNENLIIQLEFNERKMEVELNKTSNGNILPALGMNILDEPSEGNEFASNAVYDAFQKLVKFNTKLKWFKCNIFCINQNTINITKGKDEHDYFIVGGSKDENHFLFYATDFPDQTQVTFSSKFTKHTDAIILDAISLKDCFALAKGKRGDPCTVSIVYFANHEKEYTLRNTFKPFYFCTEDLDRYPNYNNVFKTATNKNLYFINGDNEIVEVGIFTKDQGRVMPRIEEGVLKVYFHSNDMPQMIEIGDDFLYIGTELGNVVSYDLRGQQPEKRAELGLGLVTAMRWRQDKLVLATIKGGDGQTPVVALHVLDAKLNLIASKVIPDIYDHIKIIRIMYMTVKGSSKTIILTVPNSVDATLISYELCDNRLLHISNKHSWWPGRKIHGMCQYGRKILVFGENTNFEDNGSSVPTVAKISF